VLDLPDPHLLDASEIGFFRQESSNDAVVVLVRSPLTGTVGMGKLQTDPSAFGQDRVLQARHVGELGTVVEDDR